jgi:hypothetical protein
MALIPRGWELEAVEARAGALRDSGANESTGISVAHCATSDARGGGSWCGQVGQAEWNIWN